MAKSGIIQGTLTQGSEHFRSYLYWRIVNSDADRLTYNRSLIRIEPLIDTTSTGWTWQGSVSNLNNTIGSNTKNDYGTFTSDNTAYWSYSASNSPTGRAAENIMSLLSTPYYEAYVYHNADGTMTNLRLACSYSLPSGGYGPGNVDVSGIVSLDTIPRYATVTTSYSEVKENSVKINWNSDVAVDIVQYRLNNGNWVTVETDVNKTSGEYIISDLLPSTEYNINFDYRRRDSQQYSYGAGYCHPDTIQINTLDYTTYININGNWKKAIPYVNINGNWKEGIN